MRVFELVLRNDAYMRGMASDAIQLAECGGEGLWHKDGLVSSTTV